jgi:hypothetical protein
MFKSIALSGAVLAVAAASAAAASAASAPVAGPAPPVGIKVEMPTIKPRTAVPGTNVDANGVNLTGRPQMRLKMTDAQTQEYWDRYNACLRDQGVPLYPGRGLSPVQEDRDPAAEKACADLMPRMPIALDSDRNPRFAQDRTDEIACLNAHGDPVVGYPGGWTYRDPRTARERWLSTLEGEPARLRIERACQLTAFSADDAPQT